MTADALTPRLWVTVANLPPGKPEMQWRFEGATEITIGRGSECDVRLDHPRVSRTHAKLTSDGTGWTIACEGQNGTFLDGDIVPSMGVAEGLELEFTEGGPVLRFGTTETINVAPPSSVDGDVTVWLGEIADGNDRAAANIYERYFEQITNLARRRISPAYRRVADEEDVAQSVMHSLFDGIANGRFPELSSRENLWRLLVVMTARKAINVVEKQKALKRGGGAVRGESVLQGPDTQSSPGFDHFEGTTNTPDFLAQLEEESERQFERLPDATLRRIARLKMEGYTNDEIASQLQTTTRTVERKLQRIREVWSQGT